MKCAQNRGRSRSLRDLWRGLGQTGEKTGLASAAPKSPFGGHGIVDWRDALLPVPVARKPAPPTRSLAGRENLLSVGGEICVWFLQVRRKAIPSPTGEGQDECI
jgi:hypothetical protein